MLFFCVDGKREGRETNEGQFVLLNIGWLARRYA